MFSTLPLSLIAGVRCARACIPKVLSKVPRQRSFQSSSRVFSSLIDKDLPIPTQPLPAQKVYAPDTDILLEQLRKANSSERILELVSMHLDVMNNCHIVTAFNMIHDVAKTGQAGLIEYECLRDNGVFQSLCSRTMNQLRSFEPQEVITVLKALTKLNVHCNTYIMQALFKMLCSQINELDLGQLTFIDFILGKQAHNPLVDSLKLALPLVLQVQVDQQLDSDNLQQVVNCLSLACKAKLKLATVEKILACLQSKIADVTATQAASIIFSLFYMNVPAEGYMPMIRASFEILTSNIAEVPRSNLLSLVRMCAKQAFYYRAFLARLSERAVLERWNLDECFELLPRLHKLNFFSPELVELLIVNICNNSASVKSEEKFCLLTLSECLTFVDYPLERLKDALVVVSSAKDRALKMHKTHPYLYFKMICCWAMQGHFPKDLTAKVFNDKFLYTAWSIGKRMNRSVEFEKYVCGLSWALEIFGKVDDTFHLPGTLIEKVYDTIRQKEKKSHQYPLNKFLEIGLGGPHFFQTGIYTRNGHVIDHIVCVRTGNYPVALSQPIKNDSITVEKFSFLEDFQASDSSKIIAIIVAEPNDYSSDPEIWKSHMSLRLKSLERMSVTPVVIKYEAWSKLPDREKIPYLMREINLAHEPENLSSEGVPPAL